MINKSAIDTTALKYLHLLKEAGYSAYFVGGAVRDLLLGKTPKDFDIATNATPHQIKRVIPSGKIIGRRFRHVLLEKFGGRYEIVTFRGPVVEQEYKEDSDENDNPNDESNKKRYPDLNQFGTAEQDASRRDFTINALFYDPDSDELVDYVGGKRDIDERTVRTIGESLVRLKDDPIRILRAIRHKVKLGLRYNKELQDAIHKSASGLESTSKDRIREEFLKVCLDRTIGAFLLEASKMRVSKFITPWFDDFSEADWSQSVQFWSKFTEVDADKEVPAETGLSIMMIPLVNDVIIRAYNEQPSNRRPDMVLPDIKFFLGSEQMRGWLLRSLRISKIQTDTVLRACFYWSRMTGKWLEEGGVPKRIEGKLHTQTGALIGAFTAKVWLLSQNLEVPSWIEDLAKQLWEKNNRKRDYTAQERYPERHSSERYSRDIKPSHRNERENRNDRNDRNDRYDRDENRNKRENPRERDTNQGYKKRTERSDRKSYPDSQTENRPVNHPILDKPLVWNGPLHSPALRPIFYEDISNQWQAYRPSGLPLPPIDKAILSSKVSHNYKPEFPLGDSGEDNQIPVAQAKSELPRPINISENESSYSDNESNIDSSEPDNREDSEFSPEPEQDAQDNYHPEDEDPDDNIGNRIDGPPTSGYHPSDPDAPPVLGEHEMLTSHSQSTQHRPHRSGYKKNPRHNHNRSGRFRRGGGRGGSHGHGGHSNKSGNYKPST